MLWAKLLPYNTILILKWFKNQLEIYFPHFRKGVMDEFMETICLQKVADRGRY